MTRHGKKRENARKLLLEGIDTQFESNLDKMSEREGEGKKIYIKIL